MRESCEKKKNAREEEERRGDEKRREERRREERKGEEKRGELGGVKKEELGEGGGAWSKSLEDFIYKS